MTRRSLFIVYLYLTVVIGLSVIFWFSSLENLIIYTQDYSSLLEKLTLFLAFGFLNLLIFRAIIGTFRLTIDRLAFSRSKKEREEDKEFTVIVETLILAIAILLSSIAAIANNYILENTPGRIGGIYTLTLSILGILTAALLTYIWPLLSALEAGLFKLDKD